MNDLFNNIEQNVNKYIESTNSKNDEIIIVAHGIIYELKEEIKQLETTNSKNDEIIMVAHGIIYELKEEIKQLESTNSKNNQIINDTSNIIDELREENKKLFVGNNNAIHKLRIYEYKIYLLCFIISCLASICFMSLFK
jgi:chromosome segregation ATPase